MVKSKNTKASKKVAKDKVNNSVVVKRINESNSTSLTQRAKMTNNVSMSSLLEKYCPSSTPVLVPYLEIYRTDELYYKDYESELNNMSSDNSDNTGSSNDFDSSDSTNSSSSSKGSGSNGGGSVGSPTTSRKTISNAEKQRVINNKNHEEALRRAIKENYTNKANVDGLIRSYKSAGTDFKQCNYIARRYRHWLKQYKDFTSTALFMWGINKNFK